MAGRRYRCSWDDIAWLDADHMAGWGAFENGRRETIDFDDDNLPKLAFEIDVKWIRNNVSFAASHSATWSVEFLDPRAKA